MQYPAVVIPYSVADPKKDLPSSDFVAWESNKEADEAIHAMCKFVVHQRLQETSLTGNRRPRTDGRCASLLATDRAEAGRRATVERYGAY